MTRETLFKAFFDDAAIFPPGNMPFVEAIAAHAEHEVSRHGEYVGPFVVGARDLSQLATVAAGLTPGSLPISMVVPLEQVVEAVNAAELLPAVKLVGLEVTVPDAVLASDIIASLQRTAPADLPIHLEVPRDARRPEIIAALAGTGISAKLRTGGIRADLYPDESELADALIDLARHGVGFKATAGLHHAIRNTDPANGFEQHGFLNLLVATARARTGANASQVSSSLAEREPDSLLSELGELDAEVRAAFHSLGTCSVREPVDELIALDLLPE